MNGAYHFCEIKNCKCRICKRNNSSLNSGKGDCYICRGCNQHKHNPFFKWKDL